MLATTNDVLEVRNVGLTVDGQALLDDVSFTLHQGEKLIILGVSGSGKSLLLDTIAGNVAHAGTTRFSDAVPKEQRTFSFDTFAALSLLRVGEVLGFLEAAYRMQANTQLAERFALQAIMNKQVRVLSKGERKRVGVYAALFTNPAVAILDEPTDGMDPMMRDAFWQVVDERHGATLLTTHLWEEAARFHDRIALMGAGRLLAPPAPARDLAAIHPFAGKLVVDPIIDPGEEWTSLVVDGRRHVFYESVERKDILLKGLGPQATSLGYSVLPMDLVDTYRLLTLHTTPESVR